GILVANDTQVYMAQQPGFKLEPLMRQDQAVARDSSYKVRYVLGGYVQGKLANIEFKFLVNKNGFLLSGAKLVARSVEYFNHLSPQDISVQINYPESGIGSNVTYVEILCTQNNNEGGAYLVAGGIGERLVSVIIEAKHTQNFNYQAKYHGLP
ncbi:CG15043, partial [Drosophila busckii]